MGRRLACSKQRGISMTQMQPAIWTGRKPGHEFLLFHHRQSADTWLRMKKFNTNADLDYACRQLAAQDVRLAYVYETYGAPPMRRAPTGLQALCGF